MQNGRNTAPASGHDCRRCDVAASGEHNLDSLLSDQPPDRSDGADQTDQLDQLVETTTLKPASANGCEGNAFGDQLCFETVGNAKPAHLPAVRQGFRDGKRREEMPPRTAGGDQKPGHDGRRAPKRDLT